MGSLCGKVMYGSMIKQNNAKEKGLKNKSDKDSNRLGDNKDSKAAEPKTESESNDTKYNNNV